MTPAAWNIIVGDNRESLRALPAQHFHMSMSSPPYWKQRDYQVEGQLGMEADPEEYLRNLVEVYREVKRVLRDDGVLLVNLGDTYSSDNKHGGKTSGKHRRELHDNITTRTARPVGMPAGNLMNMPHRVAAALQADGWNWRSTIIWHKRAPMPESLQGWRWKRCRVKIGSKSVRKEGGGQAYKDNTAKRETKRNRDCVGGEWVGGPQYEPCPGCKKCEANDGWVLQRGKWRPTNSHGTFSCSPRGAITFATATVPRRRRARTHTREGRERTPRPRPPMPAITAGTFPSRTTTTRRRCAMWSRLGTCAAFGRSPMNLSRGNTLRHTLVSLYDVPWWPQRHRLAVARFVELNTLPRSRRSGLRRDPATIQRLDEQAMKMIRRITSTMEMQLGTAILNGILRSRGF